MEHTYVPVQIKRIIVQPEPPSLELRIGPVAARALQPFVHAAHDKCQYRRIDAHPQTHTGLHCCTYTHMSREAGASSVP